MATVTYIIFDTNILHVGRYKDFSEFGFNNFYNEILGKIERHDVVQRFVLLVPQISIDEIYKQQLDAFHKAKDELLKIKNTCDNIYGINIEVDLSLNYSEFLLNKKESYLKSNEINTLPICNENRFTKIVERALDKKAPFEGGEKGKSDKGFKDALIWESIMEFASSKEEEMCEFIFITNDKGFKWDLIEEFKTITDKEITFYTKDDKSEIDLQIEKYSEEKVIRDKLEHAQIHINEILEDYLNHIEINMQGNIEVNGLNCNASNVELIPNIIDLNEYGNDIFQFKIKGKLLAEKPGVSYNLNLSIKSIAEFNNKEYLVRLTVDEVDAKLSLSEDSVNLIMNPIEFLIDIEHEIDLEEHEVPEELKSIKEKNKTGFEKHCHNNYQYNLDWNIYVQILLDNEIDVDEEDFTEFLRKVEQFLTIDWYEFSSQIAKIKLKIKRYFQKKQIVEDRINSIVELLLDEMKNYCKKENEVFVK